MLESDSIVYQPWTSSYGLLRLKDCAACFACTTIYAVLASLHGIHGSSYIALNIDTCSRDELLNPPLLFQSRIETTLGDIAGADTFKGGLQVLPKIGIVSSIDTPYLSKGTRLAGSYRLWGIICAVSFLY